MTIEDFLSRLEGVKRSGRGWVAKCPAHDDRNPSLSISQGSDGRILAHCHAGCAHESIVAAMGLTMPDLMPENGNGRTPVRATEPTTRPTRGNPPRTFTTAREAVESLVSSKGKHSMFWGYHNAEGDPVGGVARWDSPDGGKDIRPVSLDDEGWRIGAMPTPRPLYGLPDLADADCVYVCEGEKAADAGRSIGLVGTTSAGGSNAASKADWTPLAGKQVVILPDHDAPGEHYAEDVVTALSKVKPAPVVRVVRLVDRWPDLPRGGDLADLPGLDDDAAKATIRAEIEKMASEAEPEELVNPISTIDVYRPFPDVLPEPLRTFVSEGAKAIGIDPSFIALPMLAVCGAAIGTTRRIQLKPGWEEPPVLWTVIVGDSGTKKTPAFRLALKALREIQSNAFEDCDAKREAYAIDKAVFDVAMKKWKSKPSGDPPVEPEEPFPDRCIVSDTTVEALAPILKNNPRGVLMARDEVAGWFGSHDRYASGGNGGGDVSCWLSMFNAEPVTVDRKTGTQRTIHIPCAAVSLTGGIQPEVLGRVIGRNNLENGLAARILMAYPPKRVVPWTTATVSRATEDAMLRVVDTLHSLSFDATEDDETNPVVLELTSDAQYAWEAFYDEHSKGLAAHTGAMAACLSKLEGYAARLALIFHLVRVANGDATIRERDRVDSASLRAAIVLVRWFGNEARRIYGMFGESPEDSGRRKLIDLIQSKGGSISGSELVRAIRSVKNVAEAESALGELVDAGFGGWEQPSHHGPGKPRARRFVLDDEPVNDVNVYDNPSGDIADGNIVDIDTVDTSETHPEDNNIEPPVKSESVLESDPEADFAEPDGSGFEGCPVYDDSDADSPDSDDWGEI